jgi:hypothetical protein
MPTLGDLASVIRSKNAGPFQVTIDIMFAAVEDYRRTLKSSRFTPAEIARRYMIDEAQVVLIPFERVRAIKITIPRRWGSRGSGSMGDRDVYGAQQHGPLVDLEID